MNRLEIVKRLVDKYGPLIVVLFALTPLPDDLLLVPLGMMKYDAKTMAVSILTGKIFLALILAYAGLYGVEYLSKLFETSGWISVFVSIVALMGIVVLLLRVDWEKALEKNMREAYCNLRR